jgi:Na+/H+ antiporter NhaA
MQIIDHSKIAILAASTVSGLAGFLWLSFALKKRKRS